MTLICLVTALGAVAAFFLGTLARSWVRCGRERPKGEAMLLGMVTNFFDTLGIGSFAPTMAWMRLRRLVPDPLIAPTMLAGHSLPTFVQSAVFLVLLGVRVEPVLLVGSCVAMVFGGLIGVPIARHAPVRLVRLLVALALLAAAVFYILANLSMMPGGGQAAGLPTSLMGIVIAVHVVLGVLMNFGVGAYAPTLVMLSAFGMDPRFAFPIMTSAGAFLMGSSGIRLVREAAVDLRIVIGMALGGIPAVLVAAFIVREMHVIALRWLVVVVVLYAAATLIHSALFKRHMD